MNDFEKIIELLDKNFNHRRENVLNEMIKKDPEARKISNAYFQLKTSLKRNEHIDEELMGEYVLYKNNLPPKD
ncbi:MAG: hypothetical protein IPI19_16560 [Ignavibacteriales bacterium]|nr:hypothetical protein [Ignavibacteriales bacterium]